MSKKQIDSMAIENELKGASQFFPTTGNTETAAKLSGDPPNKKAADPKQEIQSPQPRSLLRQANDIEPATHETKASQPPAPTDITIPSNHETVVSRHHDTMIPSMVESIRKAVKLVGKEAATHRFTPEEKQAIADIIYTYRRQGYDTSENEIARIAINWLVWEHQEKNEESILAHVLKALKE